MCAYAHTTRLLTRMTPTPLGYLLAACCIDINHSVWHANPMWHLSLALHTTRAAGIRVAHTDFTGRALPGYSTGCPASGQSTDCVDRGGKYAFAGVIDDTVNALVGGPNGGCHSHGTHVAGLVAGATYGVAKAANVIAVQALSCDGSGTNSGIIDSIQWAVSNALERGSGDATTAIITMSLGGPPSAATDAAVAAAHAAGIVVVAAAGNSAKDACEVSPARAPQALTVGATTSAGGVSGFSNWGPCASCSCRLLSHSYLLYPRVLSPSLSSAASKSLC